MMTDNLLNGVVSQYIDDNGKTRMLNYSNISLMISPIPPLDIRVDKTPKITSLNTALNFIKERNLEITMQDGTDGQIQGLWVSPLDDSIYYGYIPIEISNRLEGYELSPPYLENPLETDDTSELESMRRDRKVADFLKHYTLYEYARDPEKFGKDSFEIVKDYKYDIDSLGKRLFYKGNTVMYRNGKLVVPDEDVRDRLMAYLKINLLNDTPGVLAYKDKKVIEGYYRTISDFRKSRNALIFLNISGILRWKQEQLRNINNTTVSSILKREAKEPYFYRNIRIKDGELCVVQNVKGGDLTLALTVADKWMRDKVNLGYSEHSGEYGLSEGVSYEVYSQNGKIKTVGTDKRKLSVIMYDENIYAALLFV